MRTKASIKGHAIHQMLIPFPLGLLITAFIFDTAGYILNIPGFIQTGYYMSAAGILFGLIAGIAGFIDYVYSVPPESSAFKRATRHMLLMITTLTLFAIAWILRREDMDHSVILLLELSGSAAISIGGWMGGTLVSRNFIGPDHRYAESGKWKEAEITGVKGETVIVAESDELKLNQMKLLMVNGERLVLAKTEDGYKVFQDRCTHRGGSLADGVLICGTVQCLWHGSQFFIKTGDVKSGPAKEKIKTYDIIQNGDKIALKVDF